MSVKRQFVDAIQAMPESVTIEDAFERLYRAFRHKQARSRDEAIARLAQRGILSVGAPNSPMAYAMIPAWSTQELVERLLDEERGE